MPDLMPWQGVWAVLMPLIFLVILGVTCWAWGAAALRLASPRDERPDIAADWALAAAFGLGLVGQGIFLLGLAGRLSSGPLLVLFVCGHLLAVAVLRRDWLAVGRAAKRSVPFFAASLPTLILALYPPTGFDATVYHLPYATRFLELGGLAFLPELRFPLFPQLAEMTFVPAVLWFGDTAAQLCQALCLVLGGGVVYDWGRRRGDAAVGLLCAALWLGLPLMAWTATSAYVDVELALFVAAGAAAWDRRRFALAGMLLGFAAATKYLGLFFLGAVGVLACSRALRRSDDPAGRTEAILPFGLAALASAGPWYLRQVVVTGNPLFPFYTQLFGDNAWTTRQDAVLRAAGDGFVASLAERMAGGLGRLLTLPWDGVFRREVFHFAAPTSPWYLLLVPLLLCTLLVRRDRLSGVFHWLWIVAAYALFWLTTLREIRFWLPASPLLHLPLALVLARSVQPALRCRRRPELALVLLLVLPSWTYGVYKLVELGPLPVSREARADFLDARVSGHAAIRFLNGLEPPASGVYGYLGERLRHYAEPRFEGDWFGTSHFGVARELLGEPARLETFLRQRSLDHLLMRADDPALRSLRRSDRFRVVYEDPTHVLFRAVPDRVPVPAQR